MKKNLYSIEGKKIKEITLPEQFNELVRPDIIKRAVLVIQSKKRTPYGISPIAGKRASVYISKRRRRWKSIYGSGRSRTPRKVMTSRGSQFFYVGAFSPNTVGGRRAHPPKSEKEWKIKVNKKERLKAIRSALAATINKELVQKRGHKIESLNTVIDSKIESLSKTKDVKKALIALGLEKELVRVQEKKVRSGKGKSRGRKYKTKVGPLLVISKDCPLQKSAAAIQGIDICKVQNLNTELLAPGTIPGRLTLFTEDSIKLLQEYKLFTTYATPIQEKIDEKRKMTNE